MNSVDGLNAEETEKLSIIRKRAEENKRRRFEEEKKAQKEIKLK